MAKINEKEAGIGPYLKNSLVRVVTDFQDNFPFNNKLDHFIKYN